MASDWEVIRRALLDGKITPDEATDLIDAISLKNRKGNFFDWCKYYMPDTFNLPFCKELHTSLFEDRFAEVSSTLAPRAHAKTTISCVAIPLFIYYNETETPRHFLNIQTTSTKASVINISIRHHIESNEKLRADYGSRMGTMKWTEKQFMTIDGTIFTAIGSGESVRGINFMAKRPDYIIADDIYDENCISNYLAVKKINTWFMSSILPSVDPGKKSHIHVRGTAINRSDLMHVLQSMRGAVCRKFKAVNEESKTVLWKENPKMNYDSLMEKKKLMGSFIFSREYQNDIKSDDESIIRTGWIQRYDGRQLFTKDEASRYEKENQCEMPEYREFTFAAIDPAEKTKEINDQTAVVGIHVTNLKNIYVFYANAYRKTFNENLIFIKQFCATNRIDRITIETNKGQQLYDEIRRTTGAPIYGKHETRDKLERLRAQQAKFENGKVFISSLIPDTIAEEMIDQLTTNHAPHDDLRDALLLAIETSINRGLIF